MTLLEVAKVVKPHGLRGEVVVALVTNRLERLDIGSVLTVVPPPGASQPVLAGKTIDELTVTASRPHGGRHLVYFASVDTYEDAEALRNMGLHAPPLEDADALFVHELIGKTVVERAGVQRGVVTGIEANPASDLLVIDGRYYVPARFVVEVGEQIVIDPPEGLFS